MALSGTVPVVRSEQAKQRQLAIAKRRATALLGAATVVFVGLTVLGGRSTVIGYLQATAEASMVGGLADWFAVTALFRRPLGLPIPHTAIVVERKDAFALTLGDFIQESFLTPDSIVERVRAAGVVPRAAAWLATPANAARAAGQVAEATVAITDLVHDDDVQAVMVGLVRDRAEAVPLAPLAGKALHFLTTNGRHQELVDAGLTGLNRYLGDQRDELRQRLAQRTPWWLPVAVEDRIFDRLLDGARGVLQDMAADPAHPLRLELDSRLAKLAADLESSPALRQRGEQLKRDILSRPELVDGVAAVWRDFKQQLRHDGSDPDSELRTRLATAVASAGDRLRDDPAISARVSDGIETGARYVAEHFHGEIATLVSTTIARWDAGETSRRLELLLGPDLQYIRINGTVVGAGAGLFLHATAQLLGR